MQVKSPYQPETGFKYHSDASHVLRLLPRDFVFDWTLTKAWYFKASQGFIACWWKDPTASKTNNPDLWYKINVKTENHAARIMAASAYDVNT